eukprot:scaffold4058_cov257-Pinguiococcus_pyrenoidosus.AAC.3
MEVTIGSCTWAKARSTCGRRPKWCLSVRTSGNRHQGVPTFPRSKASRLTDSFAAKPPGSVNPKWTFKQGIGANRLRFLPRLVPSQLPETEAGFRWASDVPELREFVSTSTDPALHLQPNNVTWVRACAKRSGRLLHTSQQGVASGFVQVLFHSMAAFNFGHMLWDDLLPVFYLSKLFGLSMADSPPKDGRATQAHHCLRRSDASNSSTATEARGPRRAGAALGILCIPRCSVHMRHLLFEVAQRPRPQKQRNAAVCQRGTLWRLPSAETVRESVKNRTFLLAGGRS